MESYDKFLKAYEMMEAWISQPNLSPKLYRELSSIENRLVENSGDKARKN